jgi:hypothetical protein
MVMEARAAEEGLVRFAADAKQEKSPDAINAGAFW